MPTASQKNVEARAGEGDRNDRNDPIAEFRAIFARVTEEATKVAGPGADRLSWIDPTAMTLATADASGMPSARMVLLKGVDERGFQFFTNYESRKGRELAANPRAALCWHWAWVEIQVRAEGAVERLSAAESDAYFASRPRGHQIGAWASAQSTAIAARSELLDRVAAAEARFADGAVERPPYWGGFLLRPRAIEFWHGQPDRLHERRRFTRAGESWHVERLSP